MKFFWMIFFSMNCAYASTEKFRICLTGSTEKSIPGYGDAFVNGAKFALKKLPSSLSEKIDLVVDFYESTPLAAAEKVKALRDKNCSSIIGFSTGNDLIAANEELKKSPIFTISIYGDPHKSLEGLNYLKILQPPPTTLLKHLLKNAPTKIQKKSKILVITTSDRSEMVGYKKSFTDITSGLNISANYVDILESEQNIAAVEAELKKESNYDFVVLFTRSSLAAKITDLLPREGDKLKATILGTKYFGTAELPAYLKFVSNKNITAYMSRQNTFDTKNKEIKQFQQDYQTEYSTPPMLISLDTFNVVNYLALSIGKIKSFSSQAIIDFFNKSKQTFIGVGGIKARPLKDLKHTHLYLIEITKDGYRTLE